MKRIILILFFVTLVFSLPDSFLSAKEDLAKSYNLKRATEEIEKGDWDEAILFIEKEIEENPKNPHAYLILATINLRNMEFGQLFDNVNKSLKYMPKKDKEKIAGAYVLRGKNYAEIKDTLNALKDLDIAISIYPDLDLAYETRGEIYSKLGNYEGSDKDYKKILSLNPGNETAYFGLAQNAFLRKNYDAAINYYDKLLALYPEMPSAYAYRGEAKLEQEKYHEAVDDIVKALYLGKDDNYTINLLEKFPSKQTPLVVAKLKGLGVKEPYNAVWPFYISLIYDSKKMFIEASKAIGEALALDEHPTLRYWQTKILMNGGFYKAALEAAKKGLELDPNEEDILGFLGEIYGNLGEIENSIEAWDHYIKRFPDLWGGYYRKGFFEDNSMKDAEALADYEMTVLLNPDVAYAWLGIGDINKRIGNQAKAIEAYEKVVSIDTIPSENSCAMYAWLELGEKEKAIEFMDAIIAKDPENTGSYYDATCLYSRIGEYDKALNYLKTSFEKGFRRFYHISVDDDLDSIRDREEYKALFNEYKTIHENEENLITNPGSQDESEIFMDEEVVEIPFAPEQGCVTVKCTINNLPLSFIFDTGASVVSLSQVEANFMLKNGYLKREDFMGTERFINANGDVSEDAVVNLKEVEFGGLKLTNVKASVVKNQRAPLLLGQTVLGRLGKIEIDNAGKKLVIRKN